MLIGGVLAIAAVVVVGSGSAQAGIIYGIDDPTNSLLSINTVTGVSTPITDLDDAIPGTFGNDSPNGLTFDGNDKFCFTATGSGVLYSYSLSSGLFSTIIDLPSGIASGTYANGRYHYWENSGSGFLKSVNPNAGNEAAVQATITTVIPQQRGTFGDIEIIGNNLFVSHASTFAIYDNIFTSPVQRDLGVPGGSLQITQPRMQLAEGSDGVLYGIDTEAGSALYTIDTATGVRSTNPIVNLNSDINHAARAVPEPGTLAMMAIGLLALAFGLQRRVRGTRQHGGHRQDVRLAVPATA